MTYVLIIEDRDNGVEGAYGLFSSPDEAYKAAEAIDKMRPWEHATRNGVAWEVIKVPS